MSANIKEKILLLLLGGLSLGCTITPGQRKRVFKAVSIEWRKINQKDLRSGVSYLYRLGFVDERVYKSGKNIFLTRKGKLHIINRQLLNIKNKNGKWDGKWRIVAFDIPQGFKTGRDALRRKLKEAGFRELQKSVFITPYECQKEISSLVKHFELEKYVRVALVESFDNESSFRKFFKLN